MDFRYLHIHGLVQKPKRQMLLNVSEIISSRRNSFSLTQWCVWYTGEYSPYLAPLHKACICFSSKDGINLKRQTLFPDGNRHLFHVVNTGHLHLNFRNECVGGDCHHHIPTDMREKISSSFKNILVSLLSAWHHEGHQWGHSCIGH